MSDTRAAILADAYGFMVTQSIGTLARAGIADLVADGHETLPELAAESGLPLDSLRRILRALAALEIFSLEGDRVQNTPKSELLRAEVPDSVNWIAQSFANEHYRVWELADQAFQTGAAATPDALGSGYFEWLGEHPAEAAIFNRAMAAGWPTSSGRSSSWPGATSWSSMSAAAPAASCRVCSRTIRRCAGSSSTCRIPRRSPVRPSSAPASQPLQLRERELLRGGAVGGDAYVLSHILHDWDDEPARRILRAIRAAADDSARLVILDNVLQSGPGAVVPKLLDLHMLVLVGGRERSEDEWSRLLAETGFSLVGIHAEGPLTAIEAATIDL